MYHSVELESLEGYKKKVHQNWKNVEGEQIYKYRAQTIERSFADAKNLHGYCRCPMRGKPRFKNRR
ncbi:transposase [Paenibacillus polymyxa]|uniref:transposase n=1 Tax=Paenibacillus polymyxa TaxID=1406 RepID=UPI00130D8CD2